MDAWKWSIYKRKLLYKTNLFKFILTAYLMSCPRPCPVPLPNTHLSHQVWSVLCTKRLAYVLSQVHQLSHGCVCKHSKKKGREGQGLCHVIWWGASSISIRNVSMGVSPISLKKKRCSRHFSPIERRAGRRSKSLANLTTHTHTDTHIPSVNNSLVDTQHCITHI